MLIPGSAAGKSLGVKPNHDAQPTFRADFHFTLPLFFLLIKIVHAHRMTLAE